MHGLNQFENLGGPIQKILMEVECSGGVIEEGTVLLLKHVTVKQLARVFDMLEEGEEPETILAWLKMKARGNKKRAAPAKQDSTKAAPADPIADFKQLEACNTAKHQEFAQMEEEHTRLRHAMQPEREKQREAQQQKLEQTRKDLQDNGAPWQPVDYMPAAATATIAAAFDTYATRVSDYDNCEKDQDGEWWKAEPYRKDWEKKKQNGALWTAVLEGAAERATDTELCGREEFFKGWEWWKCDKYRNDWVATRDAEWWKEEPYIKDWQQDGNLGTRWLAADETSGLEGKGQTYIASREEQTRRAAWYEANGPCGLVKRWNSDTQGDMEKCCVADKLAREEFYRNGDWWKQQAARQDFKENGADASALTQAAEPQDTEWWMQEPCREDYFASGRKWAAVTEEGADVEGGSEAPKLELARRQKWYGKNWWKQDKYKEDWKKQGKAWQESTQKAADSGKCKTPVADAEKAHREEWYKNADSEWWMQPPCVEDYFENREAGRHWTAKTLADSTAGRGLEKPAASQEKQKREAWYKANWWKQRKYTDDFYKNGSEGAAWTAKSNDAHQDKEWWKQAPFREDWARAHAPTEEWWKQPQYIEDFQLNAEDGMKWTAAGETAGIEGTGDAPTEESEKMLRRQWYRDNWWKAPSCAWDWAKNGKKGSAWCAEREGCQVPCSAEEMAAREAWFRPAGDMWRAAGETEGFAKQACNTPCSRADAVKRDQWYRENWWKAPEYVADWTAGGEQWCAGNMKAKDGEDPCGQAEREKRDTWYRQASDNEWWKEPQYLEDWKWDGQEGTAWTADCRQNANRRGGQEHPCGEAEAAAREQWYMANQEAPRPAKPSKAELTRRDNWYRTQLSDDSKAQRMEWLRERRENEKHILLQEVPKALEAINAGKPPTAQQVQDIVDRIEWCRHRENNDLRTPLAEGTEGEEPAIATDELLDAVVHTTFYVPPNRDEKEILAIEERIELEKWDMMRLEEEGSYRAMEAEEELKQQPLQWQLLGLGSDQHWQKPTAIAAYQEDAKQSITTMQEIEGLSDDEVSVREQWLRDNWWKAPKYSTQWRRDGEGGEGWGKAAQHDDDADYDDLPDAAGGDIEQRERWYRAAELDAGLWFKSPPLCLQPIEAPQEEPTPSETPSEPLLTDHGETSDDDDATEASSEGCSREDGSFDDPPTCGGHFYGNGWDVYGWNNEEWDSDEYEHDSCCDMVHNTGAAYDPLVEWEETPEVEE